MTLRGRLAGLAGQGGEVIRRERRSLLAILGVAVALYGFVELAGEVVEGDTLRLDRAILLALRDPADPSEPLGPRWFEETARDMTALGSHLILGGATLAAAGYLLLSRQRAAAWLVLLSVGGGMLLSSLLKSGFERPRPDLVPHAVAVYTASFPSGHAMLSAVTYLTLGALLMRVQRRRRLKVYILCLAVATTLLVGASRIYLGVHWPSDVLAGWCVGAAWALLCWQAARFFLPAVGAGWPVPRRAAGPATGEAVRAGGAAPPSGDAGAGQGVASSGRLG
ncbi:phosphatase PAP2 family protein [Roseomonas sp. OT10]|uniref:phosphatase PAP2 family protein n=1 Tax=Roseomonas cutis TaxID=2897332 RepID=UPI001E4B5D46|nr:phosphatase PAP2 family protein [Roseomonas sp. OT10]UFN49622.1 phosphatase PAP2 family protein [Roseomonas sp. OT10]